MTAKEKEIAELRVCVVVCNIRFELLSLGPVVEIWRQLQVAICVGLSFDMKLLWNRISSILGTTPASRKAASQCAKSVRWLIPRNNIDCNAIQKHVSPHLFSLADIVRTRCTLSKQQCPWCIQRIFSVRFADSKIMNITSNTWLWLSWIHRY